MNRAPRLWSAVLGLSSLAPACGGERPRDASMSGDVPAADTLGAGEAPAPATPAMPDTMTHDSATADTSAAAPRSGVAPSARDQASAPPPAPQPAPAPPAEPRPVKPNIDPAAPVRPPRVPREAARPAPPAPAQQTAAPQGQDTAGQGGGQTAAGGAPRDPYHQAPRDTVSQAVYDGWKQYNLNCARCHGEDVLGTTIAPHLITSLKPNGPVNTKELFHQTVCEGRPEKGMPAWCPLGLDDEKIDQLYAYVKARSDGKVGPGRPAVRP